MGIAQQPDEGKVYGPPNIRISEEGKSRGRPPQTPPEPGPAVHRDSVSYVGGIRRQTRPSLGNPPSAPSSITPTTSQQKHRGTKGVKPNE